MSKAIFVGGPKHGETAPIGGDRVQVEINGEQHVYFRDGFLLIHSLLWAGDMSAWQWPGAKIEAVWFPVCKPAEVMGT